MSDATAKVPMSLNLPVGLIDEITAWALRLDRSQSYLLSSAWRVSRDWMARLGPENATGDRPIYRGATFERNWFVPAETMLEIAHTSQRLGVSPESVIELAWGFSKPGP